MFLSDSNKDVIVTAAEGDLKLIPCECSGNAIYWYKTGTELDPQRSLTNDVSTLEFSSITLDDDGTYECKKEDNHTIKTAIVHVTPSEIWLLTCYQTFVEFI